MTHAAAASSRIIQAEALSEQHFTESRLRQDRRERLDKIVEIEGPPAGWIRLLGCYFSIFHVGMGFAQEKGR
jgi:hypothetical protein